jgi:hypothetical protein
MVDRPDFNYDNSGNAVVPAAPQSHDQLVKEIASADPAPVANATSAPAKIRDDKGKIVRPDWSAEKPRNESGQFLSKDNAALRQQWAKEGGYRQRATCARCRSSDDQCVTIAEGAHC